MRRWWQDGSLVGSVLMIVAAAAILGVLLFGVLVPRSVERAASAALGAPVRVSGVRPTWPPWRLRLSGVRVGPGEAPAFSAARVYVDASLGFWLGAGQESAVRLEVWGPRLVRSDRSRETFESIVRRVHLRASAEPVRLGSIRFDESTIESSDAPTVTLAGFEATDLEIRRIDGGAVTVAAELSMMSATGRLSIDLDLDEGVPVTLAVAELDGIALPVLLRSERGRLRGTGSVRVWHEAEWRDEGGPTVVGGSIVAQNLAVEIDDVVWAAAERFALEGATVEPARRAVEIDAVEASGLRLAPDLVREGPTVGAGWVMRLGVARLEGVRVDPAPSGEELIVERAVLNEVDTAAGTGSLRLGATFGGGRIEVEGARSSPGEPGQAVVSIEGLPLDRLLDGRLRVLAVNGGDLDADLRVTGPPGLSGAGRIRVRDLEVVIEGHGEPSPLLAVPAADVEVESLGPWPRRVRVHRGLLREPVLWLRRDDGGDELSRVLREPWSAEPTWASDVWTRLEGLVGASPMPSTIAPPLGVRVTDGEVHLVDASLRPQFRMRLRRVQALLDGPAGTEGPLFVRAEARGPLRSRIEVAGDTSARGVSARVRLEDGRLRDFDAYVQEWTGYEAMAGRLDVDARLRLRPVAAADIDVRVETPELRLTGEGDLLASTLGASLPDTLEQLAREGVAELSLQLEGDPEASAYGFGADARSALRASVDAARGGEVAGRASEHVATERR